MLGSAVPSGVGSTISIDGEAVGSFEGMSDGADVTSSDVVGRSIASGLVVGSSVGSLETESITVGSFVGDIDGASDPPSPPSPSMVL